MNHKRNVKERRGGSSSLPVILTAIVAVLLTVFGYFLAQSMAQHHFHGGGRDYWQAQH